MGTPLLSPLVWQELAREPSLLMRSKQDDYTFTISTRVQVEDDLEELLICAFPRCVLPRSLAHSCCAAENVRASTGDIGMVTRPW